MTDMSSFWTFIPMLLTGMGEILVNPGGYSYVFEAAPKRLVSVVQALNLVAAGAISNAITASFSPLVPEDFNVGNLNHYFCANMAIVLTMLLVYFRFVAKSAPAVAWTGV